jgi:hypothetical protein
MNYYEYIFTVLLVLSLCAALWPQANLSLVVCALLLAAIRREGAL